MSIIGFSACFEDVEFDQEVCCVFVYLFELLDLPFCFSLEGLVCEGVLQLPREASQSTVSSLPSNSLNFIAPNWPAVPPQSLAITAMTLLSGSSILLYRRKSLMLLHQSSNLSRFPSKFPGSGTVPFIAVATVATVVVGADMSMSVSSSVSIGVSGSIGVTGSITGVSGSVGASGSIGVSLVPTSASGSGVSVSTGVFVSTGSSDSPDSSSSSSSSSSVSSSSVSSSSSSEVSGSAGLSRYECRELVLLICSSAFPLVVVGSVLMHLLQGESPTLYQML